ncbi:MULTISPECIES: hypothetical protein [unclassified Exiguobacterium]|uniref:hypothetical protein n=1 Tax=unclassified Exiguobacterium TaxID=2644629 RepID=UPI00103AB2A9|nr:MULTISPECIES: hypothetical protein [unclassified Exiguobacterium]TCI65209.1 hypothetical protein EVJ21_01025 [Exiguobacterium sp. SH0S2]TCI80369.1 hypothetical protein EVJ20_03390 [Exiguobacterium sp. SH0S1]
MTEGPMIDALNLLSVMDIPDQKGSYFCNEEDWDEWIEQWQRKPHEFVTSLSTSYRLSLQLYRQRWETLYTVGVIGRFGDCFRYHIYPKQDGRWNSMLISSSKDGQSAKIVSLLYRGTVNRR